MQKFAAFCTLSSFIHYLYVNPVTVAYKSHVSINCCDTKLLVIPVRYEKNLS